ncbi:MAG: LPS assembly protein LptD, partial [candidate division NC10 bacterium]|nr:LPS assembly protein LptD [candidate division NC10 bacterium]
TITPCPSEEGSSPDWQFRAREATIHLNESALAKGASFWVKRVPLLYSPLLAAPAGERKSGFLIPQPGYGTKEGFVLKTSYFWAISPSQDATFQLNIRTQRGLEEGIEYRYLLSQKTRGYFHGTYTYDQYDETNRWKITFRHQQDFTPQLAGRLSLNLQNTSNYQRIYSQETEVRSQRLLPSEGYVAQQWNSESLLLWGNYTKDLRQHDHLYRLPELDLLSCRQLWQGIPLTFRLQSSAAYFEGLWSRDLGRLDLYPRLTLPISLGGFATLTPLAAFRETFYTRGTEGHDSFSREIYQLQARLDSHLSRTFTMAGEGVQGIQHVIEPMVAYEYIPEEDQRQLNRYDYLDFISPQNGLTYSLTNRLWLRRKDEQGIRFREILTLRLSQSYNLHGPHQEYPNPELGIAYNETRDALGLRYSQRRFSDINGHLTLNPFPFLNLAVDANFDPGGNHLDTLDPYLRLRFPKNNVELTAGYHYAPELDIQALHGKFDIRILERLDVSYYSRYNFENDTFLENKILLTFFGRCWSVSFGYIRRPNQHAFRFSFDLATVSGVK